MNFKPIALCCKWFLVPVALLSLALAGAGYWLVSGERDISRLNPALESALAMPAAQLTAEIGASRLNWESWREPARIDLETILLRKDGAPFLRIPRATVRLDLWALLRLRVVVERLTLQALALELVRKADGVWVLVGEGGQGLPLSVFAQDGPSGDSTVHAVVIADARLFFYDEARDRTLSADSLHGFWQQSANGRHRLNAQATLTLGAERIDAALEAELAAQEETAALTASVSGINPARVCELFTQDCLGLPALDMPLAGRLAVTLGHGYGLQRVHLALKGTDGTFTYPAYFAEPLALSEFAVVGTLEDGFRSFELEQLDIALGETLVSAQGRFGVSEKGYSLALDGIAQQMPVEDLYKYWPLGLASDSREWARRSVRKGMATQATVRIRLDPEDFMQPFLPDDFLSSEIRVEGADLHYIEGYPEVRDVDAVVRFTGTTMTAEASRGTMLSDTTIAKANIVFTDLNKPETPVEIAFTADAAAADIVAFLSPPRFDLLARLPVDASAVSGRAAGDVSLAFNAFSDAAGTSDDVNWDKVRYEVAAAFTDLSGLRLGDAATLQAASGDFKADGEGLTLALDGRLIPHLRQVKGEANLALDYRAAGGVEALEGALDLTPASFAFDAIGFEKHIGQPAELALTREAGDAWGVAYQSESLNARGELVFDAASQQLKHLTLAAFQFGRNDLAVEYRVEGADRFLSLKGPQLDLVPLLVRESDEPRSISDFPRVRLDLAVDAVYLPQEQEVQHVSGHIDCTGERCESADVTATFPDKSSMLLKIARDAGGARQFHLQTDNTGNLLRALDALERAEGGTLALRGYYDDSKPGNPLDARLTITDFVLKDAPILGRILNLGSLSGLLDTLRGAGMAFSKVQADIVFAQDVATVKNGRMRGPSLGVTAEGTVNLARSELDLSGNLAPAYAINSVLSKVPLIGEMLAGGEGQGIFAIDYSVRGPYANPDIAANPLSVLTPGFTRKFFDLFKEDITPSPQ